MAYLDDNPTLYGQIMLDVPVAGGIEKLTQIAHEGVIVGIGNGQIRQKLFMTLREQGERLVIAQHPTAVVAPDVEIGPGTMICASVVVNTGSIISQNVILNTACTVDHHNHIGDHAHIAPGVNLGGDVSVGQGTLVGIGATVLPQRKIGAWSTIGAGAVVVDDLPDQVTAVGNPARIISQSH